MIEIGAALLRPPLKLPKRLLTPDTFCLPRRGSGLLEQYVEPKCRASGNGMDNLITALG